MSSQNIQTGHVFLGDFIDGSFHQDGALEHFSSKNPAQNNQLSSAPKVSDKPCKKWVQMTCITTPCPPTCVER